MARRLVQILVGLVVGLTIAELVFWLRDDGAFPHLNIYRSDEALGVRLRPGATERIRFGGNPTTKVRVNSEGYRGADWPQTSNDAIAVVGDSQVFGLGVEEDQTFSARLAEALKRPVLNAGVPTLGPPEMLAVTRELIAKQKPRVVVFTINLANDLFEVARPNRDRHRVWDGWAVRIETAPDKVVGFPFRDVLMRESHLVYAARRALHDGQTLGSLPSEGTWRDLAAIKPAAPLPDDQKPIDKRLHEQLREVDYEHGVFDGVLATAAAHEDQDRKAIERKLVAARGSAGDIVGRAYAMEESRSTDFTAYHLYRGARALANDQERISADDVRRAVEYREALRRRFATLKHDAETTEIIGELAKTQQQLGELRRESLAAKRAPTPLDATLAELATICAPPRCEPVIMVLPIDLQISADEWRKYGLEPGDLSNVAALTSSVLATARALGMRTLDAAAALTSAEPGAFLQGDIHMTPKGHAAVADALAATIASQRPLVPASGELPPGRSRVPSAEEFRHTPEAIVRGSGKAGCETVLIDEWLRVQCRGPDVRHIVVLHGDADAFVNANHETMTWLVPVLPGRSVSADFVWAKRTQRLTAKRDDDGKLDAEFAPPSQTDTPIEPVSPENKRLCELQATVSGVKSCGDVYGSTRRDCFLPGRAQQDAQALLECAQGFPKALERCEPGNTIAGGTLQCFAMCNDATPCASGSCVPWPPATVCLGGP